MSTGVLETQETTAAVPNLRQDAPSSLARFVPFLAPYRWYFIGSIAASIVATLTGLVIPLVLQGVIDGPITDGNFAGVWWPAALVLLLGTIDAVGIWIRRYLVSGPSSQFEISSRATVFEKLQRLSVSAHEGWESGQLLSRAIADLSSLRRFVAFVGPFIIINSVTLVVGLGVLFLQSWQLGLIMLVTSVPLVVICTRFETLYRVVARDAQDQAGDVTTTVEESIQGIRVLKAFGRSAHLGRRFLREAATLRGTEMKKVRYLAILWSLIVGIPPLGIGAMLAFGAYSIVQGTMTAGMLVAAMAIVAFLLWPIEAFGFLLAELNNARTAADRYWEIMDTAETITEPDDPVTLPQGTRGVLEFRGVGFAFPDSDAALLTDVDFRIDPGETVALVGVTGSGKTALTNLVPRLFDVTSGSITVDGIDIRTMSLADLRSVVSVAFEDPVLFSASVRENVALGRPDATDADVDEALGVAHAREFVDALPWGLDTRIGEQGMSLSGGQRQRLALARAVLGKPRILVLDDPLSALDVGTEALVQRDLRRVLTHSTTLLVAHRPSTAALADRVLYLENGTIVEQGTHERLLATSTRYRHVMGSLDD
ncbi:ABC transporter ATP-binding protein [Rhodococcus sp. 06-156-3C]|uniref:ABC transporter ATP-binding protein n=1 Tax=Nocardiaceae TaxID=85025 RepID=UPI000522F27F|nr:MULTISPECIES: ABC transporter ATP-binding protein [Rhodococcus]OZD14787.1 ABC transporter ATP-binding protein [Rhodococcus sp. 06-156-4C]OZD20134.1 ABC transporter ATP-binding protein [Rhodococcus sp. 06-156-4a]OZD23244.1 ABC transporter ATP-binding protein [Rhodococcus sp. 06-156-3C]OZD26152.1 ABC transporter ATP-binding protein [Rhodococcus sp. 06-156-3b]OZD38359.1 ABC transporter ATP-binding protein [Rhodococcus sp. 06-156-3]